MYGITDLRKDTLIDIDGAPYRVTEYSHTQMGRGGATVRIKVKNLITGQVIDKVYKNDAKVESAEVTRMQKQFLYSDGKNFVFMDPSSFEQDEVAHDISPQLAQFFAGGSMITALVYNDKIIDFDLPKNNILIVTEAPQGAKGNTTSGATKEVTLETGLQIQAPLFIKTGDNIKIDTRSGQYLERAK